MAIGVIAVAAILVVLAFFLIALAVRVLMKQLLNLSSWGLVILVLALISIAAVNWQLISSNALEEISVLAVLSALVCKLAFEVFVILYFKSKKFRSAKSNIAHHTKSCNELNDHIEGLKSTFVEISSFDYGESVLQDTSNFNMKRLHWREQTKNNRTHNCSAAVCKSAHDQPFKYLCKYFNIKINENSLSAFEAVLNSFSAAEQGKTLLKNQRDLIISRIRKSIPALVLQFKRQRLIRELGFKNVDLSDLYFPVYTFQYVSPGGNTSSSSDIKLDIQTLDRFIGYLGGLVSFRNSVAGQRALMTSMLRERIKTRDNYSCQICNLSVADEKNLLLEIDHIIPLSKGGITSEKNLQTLCWRCNRSKGAKTISTTVPVLR